MSLLSDDSQRPSNSLSVIIGIQGDEISARSAKNFGRDSDLLEHFCRH